MAEAGAGNQDHLANHYRRLDVSQVGDVTVARLKDTIISDTSAVQELAGEMIRLVEEPNRTRLLLNFASVEMLAPVAVGKFLMLAKRVKANSGTLKLSNLRPAVYSAFEVNRLTGFFEIAEDEAAALASF